VLGEQVTGVVGTVTWQGGAIEPGEFAEFGFSARPPDEPGTLEFPAIQTYDSGEMVRRISRPTPRKKALVKWQDVETMGLEPTTPCLQSRCSSQLSYVPGPAPTGLGTTSVPIRQRRPKLVAGR
jgi:Domain of unkown function (DUF1775)